MLQATAPRQSPLGDSVGTRVLPREEGLDRAHFPNAAAASRRAPYLKLLLPAALGAAVSVIVLVVMVQSLDAISRLGSWGYLGVFVAELANSAVLLVPTPAPAVTAAAGTALHPLLVGLVGGTAAALGEMVGYWVGAMGRGRTATVGLERRVQAIAVRWGGIALFLLAALPVPFDVAGLSAGITRYPVWRFLFYVALGKIVKVTCVAAVGGYGLIVISDIVG